MSNFELRRALLHSLFEFKNPVSLNSMMFCPDICAAFDRPLLTGSDAILMKRELDELTAGGYVTGIPGFQYWYKLTDQTRITLERSCGKLDKKDAFLFGPEAL